MARIDIRALSPLLRVDGVRLGLAEVTVHAQDEAFPGGHRWFLHLSGSGAERALPTALEAAAAPVDQEASHRLLQHLQWSLAVAGEGPLRFVLNTVDYVEVGTGDLKLGGTCSPWLS
jgi:hypothetical protein